MKKYITIIHRTALTNGVIIAARVQNKQMTFMIDKNGLFSNTVVTAIYVTEMTLGTDIIEEVNILDKPRLATYAEESDLCQLWVMQHGAVRVIAVGRLQWKEAI